MRNFNYYDFFYEDEFMILNLLREISRLFSSKKKRKKTLTINHLIQVINKGEWIEQE